MNNITNYLRKLANISNDIYIFSYHNYMNYNNMIYYNNMTYTIKSYTFNIELKV